MGTENEVLRTLRERRSVRAYLAKEIPPQLEDALMQAGRCAPNAWDRQSFVLCKIGRKAREKLVALTARHLGGVQEDHNFFGAPLVVLFLDRRENFERRADAGCALENMFLAAHSLGIGSVWINQLQGICDEPAVRDELDALGVPADAEVHGVCALGYAAAPGAAHERKSAVVWVEE